MKIIVSRYWRLELLSLVIIELLGVLLSLCFFHDEPGLAIIMSLYCILMMTLMQIICFATQHRFLGYVIYENNTYTSFFTSKKLCTINENEHIYYAKIHGRISAFHYADFILLSNSPFEYNDGSTIRRLKSKSKPILVSYDTKKMILLPYEESAPYLSGLPMWTRIFPKPNIVGIY